MKWITPTYLKKSPWARSHLHSAGPRPSHASFIALSPPCSLCGNSTSLGTNVIIKLYQTYKYSSWHHFHLIDGVPSHAKGIEPLTWLDAQCKWRQLEYLRFWYHFIITLVPNEAEFSHMREHEEDQAVKEVWEGRGPAEGRCDLARGP